MQLYRTITALSAPFLNALLHVRLRAGKEDPARLDERKGIAGRLRPTGRLYWVHAASVGEAQSALILIDELLKHDPAMMIMVTTGTVTSADLMKKRLPPQAFHQFYPVDHPAWVARFLDHWKPNMAFWMESELWPNMLEEMKKRGIPAALVNARMSKRSFANWDRAQGFIRKILSAFTLILAQTEEDGFSYRALGAQNVVVTDNIKYSAAPLPYDAQDLADLQKATAGRPMWVYASTHAGEEDLACRVHMVLKEDIPSVLTIIVPRHPHRRDDVKAECQKHELRSTLRGDDHNMPSPVDDVYIADTMGELGLFYRLSPIAMIGRSFSRDGGGGHNPIEAAQLDCAVLTGPHVQYQQKIFDEMDISDASRQVETEEELTAALRHFMTHPKDLQDAIAKARFYADRKSGVLERVMDALAPMLKALPNSQEAA